MVLTIIALNPKEEFIQFLDPSLCEITETIEENGLRTIKLEYHFIDFREDKKVKELFKLGNKLWITGDINLTDCLYVINTSVKEDIYKENSFTLECEEALVELNNAPVVSHLDITGHPNVFKTKDVNTTTPGKEVKIDWNSLNYWFGDFFNIGVVQDCLNSKVQYIPFFGTYNLMSLLRYIEKQTGNVFITRYEKDQISNTIHRYLDFLNPINVSKNWELHLEYDFKNTKVSKYYNQNFDPTAEDDTQYIIPEDKAWEITPYTNSQIPDEGYDEDSTIPSDIDDSDVADTSYEWVSDDETVIDEDTIKKYPVEKNINPANTIFRITDIYGAVLNADGELYNEGDDNGLIWSCDDIGLTENNTNCLIHLCQQGTTIGLSFNDKNYALIGTEVGGKTQTYITYTNYIGENVTSANQRDNCIIPDDSYFELYDQVTGQILYRTKINRSIGKVHPEILDFGFNLDDVQFDIDESDVYTSVSPVLQFNDNNSSSNSMTRGNFTDLLTRYKNLKVSKGDTIPMIMQKINVEANSLVGAKESLGGYIVGQDKDYSNDPTNYWARPYKPQDNTGSTPKTFEFIRATAYWNAPFEKKAGQFEVALDDVQGIDYNTVYGRNDTRNDKGVMAYSKTGTTESSDEDIYSIYNQCAMYLKEHKTPKIDLDVDVSNLQNGLYNDYDIHDKVYIKVPGTSELITAKVVETTKEANDIASNKIKLSNYTINTLKTVTLKTLINCSNLNFKYPAKKQLTARLENLDYNNQDPYSVQYLANKLLTFTLYTVSNGSRTFKKIYTKRTDAYGYVKFNVAYKPGNYEFDISFGGDEEYSETTSTMKINVSGKIETKKKQKKKTKAKTAKTKKITKTTYYDKYGRTPDKKKILAIGKPSASGDEGGYTFYGMEFKNLCPHCGKKSLAWGIYWAGNEHSNYGRFPATGNYEGGSIEGHIFCTNPHCDADYSCQGREHISGGKRLAITKSRFKSSKSDAYLLKKGKYIYQKKTETVKAKNNSNSKRRKIIGRPSAKVKQLALKIVENKTGYSAMRAVISWMDNHIGYHGYYNFQRSPDEVLNRNGGNCCDQTRLCFNLLDAAGVCEFYDLWYVHVTGHVYGMVIAKKTKNRAYVDCASDSFDAWGYVCQGYPHGSPTSRYPNLPF